MKKTYCSPEMKVVLMDVEKTYMLSTTNQEWDGGQDVKERKDFDDVWGEESPAPPSSSGSSSVWDKAW